MWEILSQTPGPALIAFAKFLQISSIFPELSGGLLVSGHFPAFSSSNLSFLRQLAPASLGRIDWTKER